jgi:ABC-2 type transport system ATP-binding protein
VQDLPGVLELHRTDNGLELIVQDTSQLLPVLLDRISNTGTSLSSIEVRKPNLETVFLHLTGRTLRD